MENKSAEDISSLATECFLFLSYAQTTGPHTEHLEKYFCSKFKTHTYSVDCFYHVIGDNIPPLSVLT